MNAAPARENTPIICLTGPTASGKSAAALALGRRWPIEIIHVDSATIYRGMDIGTAKPSKADQLCTPQHLLDIRDPASSYSAAEFAHDAVRLIRDIEKRGRLPLLCGGTMLYYKALRHGLSDLPAADPAIRADIERQAGEHGWPAIHEELARVDPQTASRLAPNDSQRIQRAMEVYRITGRSMSSLFDAMPIEPAAPYRYVTISLEPSDRSILHNRIRQRYLKMMDEGLFAEVRALHHRPDLHGSLPSMRCVGYRQLWAYLENETSLECATENAIAATRQLAKHQLTWLRAQPDRRVIDCLAPDANARVADCVATVWPEGS